jgi:hypothetical protein
MKCALIKIRLLAVILPRFSLHCLPTQLNLYTQQRHNLYWNPIRLGERVNLAVHDDPTEKCCPQPSRQPPPRIKQHLHHQPSCLAATRCLVPQLIHLRLHHLTSKMTSNVLSAPSKAMATQMSSSSFALIIGVVALIIDFAVVSPDGAMYLRCSTIPHCLLEGGRRKTLEDVKRLIPTRRRSLWEGAVASEDSLGRVGEGNLSSTILLSP